MSDDTRPSIAPAQTLEQWRDGLANNLDGYVAIEPMSMTIDIGDLHSPVDVPTQMASLIALLNNALPDDDPRKITHRMVDVVALALDNLPRADDEDYHDWQLARQCIAALYAMLPPR